MTRHIAGSIAKSARHASLGGLAAIALAACGGSGGSKSATSPSPGVSLQASSTSSPSPSPPIAIATKATVGPIAVTTTEGSPIAITNTPIGAVLSTAGGRTLYIYEPDRTSPGKSTVNGQLAVVWPPMYTADATPLVVRGASGDFSVITRDDGTLQIAYKGMPLYLYLPDKAPGDTLGDQLERVWFVARP